MPRELEISEDTQCIHDKFDRHITHLTNLSKIGNFLNSNLHDRGAARLRDKIVQELQAFKTLPECCGDAECDAEDLLKLTALAKSLGCKHDEKQSEESCRFRDLHTIICKRIRTMSLLDGT